VKWVSGIKVKIFTMKALRAKTIARLEVRAVEGVIVGSAPDIESEPLLVHIA
jgi:hypothetical protein